VDTGFPKRSCSNKEEIIMAIDQGTEAVTLSAAERTWRVEIFIERGEDALVRVHREIVKTDASGEVVARDRSVGALDVRASEIETTMFADLTGAQLYAAIQGWADGLASARSENAGPFAAPG
jgi:hypothetical protein